MAAVTTTSAALDLGPDFRGEVLRPGDAGYDEARRVYNGMIDRRPGVIARCTGVADVVAAVDCARAAGVPLSVHGGGHGVTGAAVCDDGVMVDLRPMDAVLVDPGSRRALVQGGARWGAIDRETQLHGLAVTGGRMSTTGIGGFALGSGSGWLERVLGFTCDNLVSVELVTAGGRVVRASEKENRELFWGLRGGGGNFGIVTTFELRLHPVGPVLTAGMLGFPGHRGPEILRAYREFIRTAPDEVLGAAGLMSAPPAPFVPDDMTGKPMVGVIFAYAGAPEVGEQAVRPLRDLGPAIDRVSPMPYTAFQQITDAGNPAGVRNYWTSEFLRELPDDLIDALSRHHLRIPSPLSGLMIMPGGGAIARVSDEAMAFGNRTAPFIVHFLGQWLDPADDERNIQFIRDAAAETKPYAYETVYLNFIGEEGSDRVRSAFGPEKYARLQALKREWDPANLFRMNQNIPPA